MTTQIEVEDLHLHLGSHSRGTNVLDSVSLHVDEGERLGLVGESGAGKSTLLQVMIALRQPDSGTVRFKGKSLADTSAIRELRRSVAMVFQDPRSSLDPSYECWKGDHRAAADAGCPANDTPTA